MTDTTALPQIDRALAAKVLEIVDAGLVSGQGVPTPGSMCVEAAVCYAMGLPHGDDPQCVSRALRSLKITLNDAQWSSPTARAKGLRRLAIAQLGSRDTLDDTVFTARCADLAVRKYVPIALRAAASLHPDAVHKTAFEAAAVRCETEGTPAAARAAAARADARAAAAAAAYAAAYAAAHAAADAQRDDILAMFAEDVVQILIEMNAPGCAWLDLTEAVAV